MAPATTITTTATPPTMVTQRPPSTKVAPNAGMATMVTNHESNPSELARRRTADVTRRTPRTTGEISVCRPGHRTPPGFSSWFFDWWGTVA
jgi:hypothetical protein